MQQTTSEWNALRQSASNSAKRQTIKNKTSNIAHFHTHTHSSPDLLPARSGYPPDSLADIRSIKGEKKTQQKQ